MLAILRDQRFWRNRGKTFDKVLTHRYIGIGILAGDSIQKRLDVKVWTGRNRGACRYHATATLQLTNGTVLSGSDSAVVEAFAVDSWGPGEAILGALKEAGVLLASESVDPASDDVQESVLARLKSPEDVRSALRKIGSDVLGSNLFIVE
jgi:hypothetical protein